MNTTAEKILGVRFSECLGKQLSTAIPDVLVAKKLSTLIGRAPATGENILSLCRDGGGFSFYHVNTQKINDENGADIGRVVTLLDRTENIGAMQMRTSFLSVVAHELRTPITVIKNYLEILSSNEDREIVDDLKVSCGRLELLVGKLISLAALSGASFFVNLCNTHVVNLLARCVKKLKIEIAGKNVTVKIDNKLRSPKIVTDSQLLILALTSLIDNAVKFNADGGTVSICLDEEIQSDRTAVLSIAISDQGSGISDIARAHLFESFSQGESHLTRHFGGLGTGLFLARRAVELLKGRIEVDSVEGRGSCFTIFLPLQRATKPSPIIKKL